MKTLTDREVPVSKVVKTLKKKGFVYWQGDDSLEAYEVLEKVIGMLFKTGAGRVLRFHGQDMIQLTDSANTSAGAFIAFYE